MNKALTGKQFSHGVKLLGFIRHIRSYFEWGVKRLTKMEAQVINRYHLW